MAEGINTDMALAEKALKAMDAACFGMIPRFWKVGGGFKVDDAVWADPQPTKTDPLPEAKAFNPDHRWVAALGQSGEQDSREREMEENMDEVGNRHLDAINTTGLFQVSAIIGNLRNMANDIGNATKAQNETLDRIHLKTESDILRVKMANEKAAALMK